MMIRATPGKAPGLMRRAALGALALLLAACAAVPQNARRGDDAVSTMRTHADSLIVLAVDNAPESIATHAGSTPRGYDAMPRYGAGADARAALDVLRQRYALREIAAWPIDALHLHCAVFDIADAQTRDALLAQLQREPGVRLAQPLQTFTTLSSVYNDPYFELQRGFVQIEAGGAQQWSRGEGVRIAVIDTGIDAAHPDLQGRIVAQRNFVDADAQAFARDRHGTEVAGVIAANANNREGIVGVAPAARIIALKACWPLQPGRDAAQCNSFTLAQALSAAIDAGAQIINLSLAGPADPLLAQLTAYALARGIIVVGAAPPDGREDGFPLAVPGVIAVDAAGSANSDAHALHAPGREVLTLTPGGHYDFASGSSLAAAHVSGVIALLLARDARLNAVQLAALLQRGHAAADPINACAAMAGLRADEVCTSAAAPGVVSGTH